MAMARTPAPDTRDRNLDAVTPLFYGRGVRAVGMSEVVAAAGCGKNLLYSHFPSKDDLAAAYLERFRTVLDRAAEDAVRAAGDDPAERLVALVGEVAERVHDPRSRGCPFRNHLTESTDHDALPARLCRDYLADSRERIRGLATALGVADPAGLTDRIALVLDGLHAGAAHGAGGSAGATAVALAREAVQRAVADGRR